MRTVSRQQKSPAPAMFISMAGDSRGAVVSLLSDGWREQLESRLPRPKNPIYN